LAAILLIVVSIVNVAAQGFRNVEGKIRDIDGHPLYCTIYTSDFRSFTETDSNGNFQIKGLADTDTLIFKAMGYTTRRQAVNDILMPVNLIMEADPVMVETATVNGHEAEMLIKAVVRNLKSNYPDKPYIQQGFYRQTHRQDGHYVKLIEAVNDIYDAGYIASNSEKIAISQLRRSGTYESNGDQHDDHFAGLLTENWLHYPRGTPFDTNNLQAWHLSVDTMADTEKDVKVLSFYYRVAQDKVVQAGRIFIDLQDTAVTLIENQTRYNKDYVAPAFRADNTDWVFRKGGALLEYAKQADGRYYAMHQSKWYSHTVSDHPYPGNWELDEYFDLWTDTIRAVEDCQSQDFKVFSNLYSRRYSYNETCWKTLLGVHPVDPIVIQNLNAYESLEEQFVEEGRSW
jgi:hypothetical protein